MAMEQDIGIGMSKKPLLRGNLHSADHELSAVHKAVYIITGADSYHLSSLQDLVGKDKVLGRRDLILCSSP